MKHSTAIKALFLTCALSACSEKDTVSEQIIEARPVQSLKSMYREMNRTLQCYRGDPFDLGVDPKTKPSEIDQDIWDKWNKRLNNPKVDRRIYFFEYNSIEFDSFSRQQLLKRNSEYIQDDMAFFYIQGHGSTETNDPDGNMRVSLQRTDALAQALINAGVHPDRICRMPQGTNQSSRLSANRRTPSGVHVNEQRSAELTVF